MPMSLTRAHISTGTKSDSEMQALLRYMHSGKYKKQLSLLPASYRHIRDELNATEDGVLYKPLRWQLILIPTSLRARVVKLAHRGHQEIVNTKRF